MAKTKSAVIAQPRTREEMEKEIKARAIHRKKNVEAPEPSFIPDDYEVKRDPKTGAIHKTLKKDAAKKRNETVKNDVIPHSFRSNYFDGGSRKGKETKKRGKQTKEK